MFELEKYLRRDTRHKGKNNNLKSLRVFLASFIPDVHFREGVTLPRINYHTGCHEK